MTKRRIFGEAGFGLKNNMTKGIIYYTDFHVDPFIQQVCLQQLKDSWEGDAVSVSLNESIDFEKNIVLLGERSNTMMIRQIITALENSTADYVFFCEHDVLYHPSHFEFTPPKDNVFYYDLSVWRWDYPKDRAISYNELTSLSMMCVNRHWAWRHYQRRLERILNTGWDKEDGIGKMQPIWVRALGYEPGTKRRKIGGFSDDVSERWRSETPCVDIRHNMTLSNPKTKLKNFKHLPTGWREVKLKEIPGWDLHKLFNL